MKINKTNMTYGSIWKQILIFSLPLLLSNLFQQLYSAVDSVIVGNFVGQEALAAVGSSSPIINMLTGFFMGLSVGASVIISRYYGALQYSKLQDALHTAFAIVICSGIFLTFFGVLFTPIILNLMQTPENVMNSSVLYLRIYFCGVLAVMLYNIGSAILQAVGDSRTPLYFLIIASILNVLLDILFVIVFNMGIAGAGYATIISQCLSALLVIIKLAKTKEHYKLQIKKIRFHKEFFKTILKLGVPSGMQNTAVSFSNTLVQSGINSFGQIAMAGCASYQRIEGFGILPVSSFSLAITTFVSQNLGAEQYDRAKKGYKIGILMSCIVVAIISIIMLTFAPYFLKIFNSDEEVVYYGTYMMKTIAPFYAVLAITQGIAGTLRGAYKTVVPMATMLIFWCVFRVLWIIIGLKVYNNIFTVFLSYPISWILSTIFLIIYMKMSFKIKQD